MDSFKEKIADIRENLDRKTLVSLGVVIILILGLAAGLILIRYPQILKSRASELKQTITADKQSKSYGYIVELKNDPLVKTKVSLDKSDKKDVKTKELIANAQKNLSEEHKKAKEDIAAKLGKKLIQSSDAPSSGSVTILREYTNAFNGFAMDISSFEADKIKASPYVKNVYPNLEVKALLNESVPLIGADKVWQTKNNLGENINGKGINVAVLDTGVDYTHADLGATQITERVFEKITNSPVYVDIYDQDQIFALSNGKAAYFFGNQIFLYSFVTKVTESFNALTADLNVKRIAFQDNTFAYYATDANNKPAVYYYNLTSGDHQKITNTYRLIGGIAVSNGKIIYARGKSNIEGSSGIYVYDLTTGTETQILTSGSLFKVWGDFMAYSKPANYCYEKIVIYNLKTGQSNDYLPPQAGPVLDFEDDKILYAACGGDFSWSNYYLYDIKTGASQKLHYSDTQTTNNEIVKTQDFDYYATLSMIIDGLIGNGVIYFSKDVETNRIIAYDQVQNRYVQINLLKASGTIDGEGKKVCFMDSSREIYCHDYDPSSPYNLTEKIFNNKVIDGYNFVSNTSDPLDDQGHGTHVSAIVAGYPASSLLSNAGLFGGGGPAPTPSPIGNPASLMGVASRANLIAYKVLNSYGGGTFSNVIAAIDKSVATTLDDDPKNDISVLNLSLGRDCNGNYSQYCGPDDPQSRAVDNAVDAGIAVVVAAGNSGSAASTIGSPGTARKAITVGAVDKSKQIASFSSRGPVIYNGETIHKPDIVAPGVSICAAEWGSWLSDKRCVDDKHIAINGTSMAAPHVAGLVALIRQKYPALTPLEIKQLIQSKAVSLDLDQDIQGSGLIDALASMTLAFAASCSGSYSSGKNITWTSSVTPSTGNISYSWNVGAVTGQSGFGSQAVVSYADCGSKTASVKVVKDGISQTVNCPAVTIPSSACLTPSPSAAPFCTACQADINKDNNVNTTDISLAKYCQGKPAEGACFNADINQDKRIDSADLVCVNGMLGQRCYPVPSSPPTYKLTTDLPPTTIYLRPGEGKILSTSLKDSSGNTVSDQTNFQYLWEKTGPLSLEPIRNCNTDIKGCPIQTAQIIPASPGPAQVKVNVRRLSDGQIIASLTFNVYVIQ